MVTGKFYIGQTDNIHRRFHSHKYDLNSNDHVNPLLQYSWNKHGEENFKFEIAQTYSCSAECNNAEIEFIDAFELGVDIYNLKSGGKHSGSPSEQTRAKISAAHLGSKRSEETKAKMSAWQVGRKMSAEAKEKMRQAKLGKKLAPEHIEKLRQTQLGRTHTPEHIDKVRQAQLGKFVSEETRAKQSAVAKGIPRIQDRKLTQEQADEIRRLYAAGEFNMTQLAEIYGVSKHYTRRLIRNLSYLHE